MYMCVCVLFFIIIIVIIINNIIIVWNHQPVTVQFLQWWS